MPYKNLQSLMKKTDEQCVKDWIAGLNEGSKNYAVYVLTLIEWGKARGHWQSGEDMLNRWKRLRRGRNEDTRNAFVKIFHHYVETKKFTRKKSDEKRAGKEKDGEEEPKATGTVDRKNCWAAICNFFSHFDMSLPVLTPEQEGRLFRVAEVDKLRGQFIPRMTAEDATAVIENAPLPYRAVLMTMLQAGMGGAEFEIFNESAWRQIAPNLPSLRQQLDKPGPIKVKLYRSKTSRTELQEFYTFLGNDAKRQTMLWLKMRPTCDLPYIFVVRQKGPKKHGDYSPVTTSLIEKMVTDLAKRLDLLSAEELKLQRYHIRPHRLRKVFKGICDEHGVVDWASEFFHGHKIGTYRELPWTNSELVRKEYLKAEPGLNLLSNPKQSAASTRRTMRADFNRQWLLMANVPEKEFANLDLASMTTKEVKELVAKKGSAQSTVANGGQASQKDNVVAMAAVKRWLNRGWHYVGPLPTGEAVISKSE